MTAVLTELTLDAREMEHPEPFEKATALLSALQPGHYLRMQHRRVPYPLFDFTNALALEYVVIEKSAGDYEIFVYFPDDLDTLRQSGVL